MQQKIRYLLRLAGLTEQEIKLYLLLLKNKKATIPELTAKTKLPNITVYRAVRSLQERGIIQAAELHGRQSTYSSLSLDALTKKVGAEQRKLRRLELALHNLDSLLPFIGIEEGEEELIEVHEGVEAFREEYLKIPDAFEEQFLAVGNAPSFWRAARLNYESPEERGFIERRLKRNIYARVLNTFEPQAVEFQRNDSREKRTTTLTDSIPLKNDCLMMCSTQISHFVCDKDHPRVIVIRHPELIALHEQQFADLWKKFS